MVFADKNGKDNLEIGANIKINYVEFLHDGTFQATFRLSGGPWVQAKCKCEC